MYRSTATHVDQVTLGILIILASVAVLSLGDALIKLKSTDFSLWQIFALRSAFALPCFFAIAILARRRLKPQNTGWVSLRAVLLVTGWITYYGALPWLDLGTAAVAVYTNPIFTALITAAVLKDRVTPLQWLGVLIGFGGIVVILRPADAQFSWALLGPLAGALLYSMAMILTRTKCQNEDFVSLAFVLHLGFITAGVIGLAVTTTLVLPAPLSTTNPFLTTPWVSMTSSDWALMAFLGVLATAFTLGVARAYQIAPPHIIATFDYAYVGFAILWGLVFFAEIPDTTARIGMALIIIAGLMVALGAPRPRSAPPATQHQPDSG